MLTKLLLIQLNRSDSAKKSPNYRGIFYWFKKIGVVAFSLQKRQNVII